MINIGCNYFSTIKIAIFEWLTPKKQKASPVHYFCMHKARFFYITYRKIMSVDIHYGFCIYDMDISR